MRLVFTTLFSLIALNPSFAQTITIARSGTQASQQGPAPNFTGSVRVDPLFQPAGENRASGSVVTFDTGAHSAWHTHPAGQVLIVTAGTGRVQQWGQPADEIRVDDVVRIPPNAKHWHGAAPTTSMAYISTSSSAMRAIALSGNTAMARFIDQQVNVLRCSDETVEDDCKAADEDVANAFGIQRFAEVVEAFDLRCA